MFSHLRTLILVLLSLASPAWATDVVVLEGGKMMEGRVISFDQDELVLEIESGKALLTRGDIASIHFDSTVAEIRAAMSQRPRPKDVSSREPLDFREWFRASEIEVRVSQAAIARVSVTDLFGEMQQSTDDHLQLTLEIRNTSERRILRYREGVFSNSFQLRDDVDNILRGVSFGFTNAVQGALEEGSEIDPRQSVTHVEIFRVPPPKTRHLDLTVDLSAFGLEGTAVFRITRADLGWPPLNE